MKKKLLLLAALVCTAVASFTLTSCSDDDEPAVEDQMYLIYSVDLSYQIHNVANVVIEYIDGDGKCKFASDLADTFLWKKAIAPVKGSGVYGVRVRLSGRGEDHYLDDFYNLGISTSIAINSISGNSFVSNGTAYTSPWLVPKANIEKAIAEINKKAHVIAIDGYGSVVTPGKSPF